MGREAAASAPTWDIFISYARADLDVVRPLVVRLKEDGYTVWFELEQISGGIAILDQLIAAINNSKHTIACLSDTYVERKWTRAELTMSAYRDPAGVRARTIPVLVRPMIRAVPEIIRHLAICDLSDLANYEEGYQQIIRSIPLTGPTDRPQPEQPKLDPKDVEKACDTAFQPVDDPYVALFRVRRANEFLTKYLYARDVGSLPASATLNQLIEQLIVAGRLPQDINAALAMLQTYGNFAVRDQVDTFVATRESVAPALGALKLLTDWTFDRKPVDPWPEILDSLPPGDDAGERRIPNTGYFLRQPKLSQNSLGPLYAGRDGSLDQRVSINLVALPEAGETGFFEDVARFMSLRDSSIVAPLRFGYVEVAGRRRCLYLIMPWIDGVSAQDLTRHFNTLPARAAYELCLGIASALMGFHESTPPIVHGDIKPANVLVDSFGSVRVLCVGRELATTSTEGSADGQNDSFLFSSPEQLSGARLTQKTDLFALYSVLFYVLSGNYPARNTAEPGARAPSHATDPLERLAGCRTSAEARDVLLAACRGLPESTGLRALNRRYRIENGLAVPPERSPIVPSASREFGLVSVSPIEGRKAWPLGERRVLVWETGTDTLAVIEGSDLVWRDTRQVRVRRVAGDTRGRFAVGGWDGAIRYFTHGEPPAEVEFDGAVGDLQFTPDALVAGSWKQALWRISSDGTYEEKLGPDKGVHRIAVMDNRDRFAVASLAGGIAVYANYRKVFDVAPLELVTDIAYAGARLMILTDGALTSMNLNGTLDASQMHPRAVRLIPSPTPGYCMLLTEPYSNPDVGLQAWLIDENQAQFPYFTIPARHDLISICQGEKRFTLSTPDGGCAYWRDGAEVWTWPDALHATVSADGHLIAVSRRGKVELYEDP